MMKYRAGAIILAVVVGAIGGRMTATQTVPTELPPERVTGIGGIFFKAKDPKALSAWYRQHLGIAVGGPAPADPAFAWRERDDPSRLATTTWGIFREKPCQSPTPQLPTPKLISSKRFPWELEVGSWELGVGDWRIFSLARAGRHQFWSG